MYTLILLFLGILLISIVLFNVLKKDIISPPIIFTFMFLISIFTALINSKNWNINYGINTASIIFFGCIIFSIPSVLLSNREMSSNNYKKRIGLNQKEFIGRRKLYIDKKIVILSTLVCVFILLLYMRDLQRIITNAGYTGNNYQWFIRNITNYEYEARISGIVRLLLKFIDATAYIFGFTFICNKLILRSKDKFDYLLLIPIIIFSIKTLMGGGRQDIIKMLFAFIVQSYIMNKQKNGWNIDISKKYIKIGLKVIIFGIPIFYYTLFLAGRSTERSIFDMISTYLGGSIQHFDQYIKSPIPKSSYFGNESFTSLLNFISTLGFIDYNNTIHLEYRKLGVTSGNVYTFFRRPLQDFGLIGMFIFVAIVGLFFSIFYYKYIRYRYSSINNDVICLIFSYILYWVFLASIEQYSFTIISIFTFSNIVFFVVLAYIFWSVRIEKTKIIYNKKGNYE